MEKRGEMSHQVPGKRPDTYQIPGNKITPAHIYFSRRKFIAGLGAVAATGLLAACTRKGPAETSITKFCDGAVASATTDELGNSLTACFVVTTYNNFYEFSYEKAVVRPASNLKTSPWILTVGGLVDNPGSYSVEDLVKKYPPEERIYRLRCVEAWAMVIPWLGFPLSWLLEDARPKPEAKFVRFTSFWDPEQMPGDKSLPFPYTEGLRLDEAFQDLTILATGLYGEPLPPQDGAPIRLVVPWKYGFKSAKSIVNIDLTAEMPPTFWSTISPDEYGFYANVNPNVPHPRWSQSSERFLPYSERQPTLMFNGYDQVAPLYEGMDLKKFF